MNFNLECRFLCNELFAMNAGKMQNCDCCCKHVYRKRVSLLDQDANRFLKISKLYAIKDEFEERMQTAENARKPSTFSIDAILSKQSKSHSQDDADRRESSPVMFSERISKSSLHRPPHARVDMMSSCCTRNCLPSRTQSPCHPHYFTVYRPTRLFDSSDRNHYQKSSFEEPTMVPIGKQNLSPDRPDCVDCSYSEMRRFGLGMFLSAISAYIISFTKYFKDYKINSDQDIRTQIHGMDPKLTIFSICNLSKS